MHVSKVTVEGREGPEGNGMYIDKQYQCWQSSQCHMHEKVCMDGMGLQITVFEKGE